jgi:adenylylsulfate kinase
MTSEVLLLAGRSGVGKSSVAFGCHDALRAAGVRHCVIDGDMLDMAYPTPWEHGLAERNLAAMWANYRELGYRRLIFVNSACVLATEARKLAAAMASPLRPHVQPWRVRRQDCSGCWRRDVGVWTADTA